MCSTPTIIQFDEDNNSTNGSKIFNSDLCCEKNYDKKEEILHLDSGGKEKLLIQVR